MHDKTLRITAMIAISAGLSFAIAMLPFALYALLLALFSNNLHPIVPNIVLFPEVFLWVDAPMIAYWAATDFYYWKQKKSKKQKRTPLIKSIAIIAAIIGMIIG